MKSFEDLGLSPELIEALSAEGIEQPTPLQEAAAPVVQRGNHLILAAGPGSGVMVAWALGLLERLDITAEGPQALVVGPSEEWVEGIAVSLSRLAASTGHVVAALGGRWALPDRAHIVLGTPRGMMGALKAGTVAADGLQSIVIDAAAQIEAAGALETVGEVLDYLPRDAQKVLTSLPMTDGVARFADDRLKRALTLPGIDTADGPKRGTVRFRITAEPREDAVLDIVGGMLSEGARHVLVYCKSEDRAADVADFLTLHGYATGAAGDRDLPVWVAVDALEARAAAEGMEDVMVVSCEAPTDPDSLDRRHSLSEEGVVVLLAREVAHLRDLARRTGYGVVPFPPVSHRVADQSDQIRQLLRTALAEEDTTPYLLALEELFTEFDPAEVAAAAVALLRKKPSASTGPQAAPAAPRAEGAAPAWAKLFLGVGERDGVSTRDLLGAITGEAGVKGASVGRIDIKESHTLVEVHDEVAQKVIKALNGTTIRGRAVRADFDRPRRTTTRTQGGRTT